MPKPLRLPDDDRPRKKKKPAQGEGLPVGPLIGVGVGGVLLLGLVGVVWWAVSRDGPPPARPAPAPTPASTPTTGAKTPPTQAKPPTADEYYQYLVGGVWTRTADDPVLGGKKTVKLTFLPDKTLVVKQSVPDLLGGLTGGEAGKDRELATSMGVTVEVLGDRLVRIKSTDTELLGAGFRKFRLRFEPNGDITLTETGDESKFQATPYVREK